jgi:hypothetical protein
MPQWLSRRGIWFSEGYERCHTGYLYDYLGYKQCHNGYLAEEYGYYRI